MKHFFKTIKTPLGQLVLGLLIAALVLEPGPAGLSFAPVSVSRQHLAPVLQGDRLVPAKVATALPAPLQIADNLLVFASEGLYRHAIQMNEFFQKNTTKLMKLALVFGYVALSAFLTAAMAHYATALTACVLAGFFVLAVAYLYAVKRKEYKSMSFPEFVRAERTLIGVFVLTMMVIPLGILVLLPANLVVTPLFVVGGVMFGSTILLYSLRIYQFLLERLNGMLNAVLLHFILASGRHGDDLESPKHIKWLSLRNVNEWMKLMGRPAFWGQVAQHPKAIDHILVRLAILSRAQKLGGLVREYPEFSIPAIIRSKIRSFGVMPSLSDLPDHTREILHLLYHSLFPSDFDLTKIRKLAVDLGALNTEGQNARYKQLGPYPLREQIHNYPSRKDLDDTIAEWTAIGKDIDTLRRLAERIPLYLETHDAQLGNPILSLKYDLPYVHNLFRTNPQDIPAYVAERIKYLTAQQAIRQELIDELQKMYSIDVHTILQRLKTSYSVEDTSDVLPLMQRIEATIGAYNGIAEGDTRTLLATVRDGNLLRTEILAQARSARSPAAKEMLMQLEYLIEGWLQSGVYARVEHEIVVYLGASPELRSVENTEALFSDILGMLDAFVSATSQVVSAPEDLLRLQGQIRTLMAMQPSLITAHEWLSVLGSINAVCSRRRENLDRKIREGLDSILGSQQDAAAAMDYNPIFMGFYRDQGLPFISALAAAANKLTLLYIDQSVQRAGASATERPGRVLTPVSADQVPSVLSFDDVLQVNKDVRGGKGLGLALMRGWGLPVPPGMTLPTTFHRGVMNRSTGEKSRAVADLMALESFAEQIRKMERETGRPFNPANGSVPLLVSVRSGAPVSMPGQMETILNVGITAENVRNLMPDLGTDGALRAYLKFVTSYEKALHPENAEIGQVEETLEKMISVIASPADVEAAIRDILDVQRRWGIPADPHEQMQGAILGVLDSWESDNAKEYRTRFGIADTMGTAVNIQAMVFGNSKGVSGTGVFYSMNPNTGTNEPYGVFLPNAQGDSVVSGKSSAQPISTLQTHLPELYQQLADWSQRLFDLYGEFPHEIEFTIENGKLWILQIRNAKLSVQAHMHFIMDSPDPAAALDRYPLTGPLSLLFGVPDLNAFASRATGKGVGVTPGIVSGQVVTDKSQIVKGGGPYIYLVSATDVDIPEVAGLITVQGSTGSHASIVARERNIVVALDCGTSLPDLQPGQVITLVSDGNTTYILPGNEESEFSADTSDPKLFKFLELLDSRMPLKSPGNEIEQAA